MENEIAVMLQHVRKFRKIMKNYMEMNYSRKFIRSGKYHLVNASVTPERATGIYPIVTGKQIGRASCRERVSSPV